MFVEIGNRKNRENDRYDQIMRPFMHKLSSYFRFLSWCGSCIKYPKELNGLETEFKSLVAEIGGYGGRSITSGGDYGIGYFTAAELNKICLKINNIWNSYDKMNPCGLSWEDMVGIDDYISNELKDFFPYHLSKTVDVNLVSNVSGEFYTAIYQPIKYETYKHEVYVKHFKRQTVFVAFAVGCVLLVLTTMLFVQLPVWIMQVAGIWVVALLIMSLLLLGVDANVQIQHYNRFIDFFANMRKCETDKNSSPVSSTITSCKMLQFIFNNLIYIGLLLVGWVILSVEVGVFPKIPVPWGESVVLGVNKVLLNLSYSYIAGVIVYWFVVKLPSLRK